MSYASHFEGLIPRISKIYISSKSSDPTGNDLIFPFLWSKWPISTPDIRYGHVIHQIEANEPGIIIKIVLAENFYQESKYIEKFKFLKIFTDDVIVCLPDQKWSQSSNSVIRGLNKSVLYNFIMGRLSLKKSSDCSRETNSKSS